MTARVFAQMLGSVTCGDCIEMMAHMPRACVDFVLTDPPFLVRYRDRSGRSIAKDADPACLCPASAQTHRVLREHALFVSFYGMEPCRSFSPYGRAERRLPPGRAHRLPQVLCVQGPLPPLPTGTGPHRREGPAAPSRGPAARRDRRLA